MRRREEPSLSEVEGISLLTGRARQPDCTNIVPAIRDPFNSSGRPFIGARLTLLGTFPNAAAYHSTEEAMRAYFTNLSTRTWMLLVISAVVAAYPMARIVVPAVIHAIVPDVVRILLSVI